MRKKLRMRSSTLIALDTKSGMPPGHEHRSGEPFGGTTQGIACARERSHAKQQTRRQAAWTHDEKAACRSTAVDKLKHESGAASR